MNKKIITIAAIIILIIVFAVAYLLYPKFTNMKSEYATASIMRRIGEYVAAKEKWPTSAEEIKVIQVDDVYVNYDVTLEEIVKDKKILENAVRPESGKHFTYPHYKTDINNLFDIIKQVLTKEPASDPN
jgi:flagellar basal body-associated protein FliL